MDEVNPYIDDYGRYQSPGVPITQNRSKYICQKNVDPDKNNIIRNQDAESLSVGEVSGSQVGSWKLLNGTGRYKDLSGLVLKGAYLSIGKNKHNQTNWI